MDLKGLGAILSFIACIQTVCLGYPSFGNQEELTPGVPPPSPPPSSYKTPSYDVNFPTVYPPKSQYNYPPPSSVNQYQQHNPALIYVDPPQQYYQGAINYPEQNLYNMDGQSTTEAPSGIWKIFSIFSLPDLFSHKPEETPPTDYSNKPPGYEPAPHPNPSTYYNYAIMHQQQPIYQVPAPGSNYPTGSRPSYYSQPINTYVYRPSTTTTASASVKPTTTTPRPTIQYPSSVKPVYSQPHLPAYSIYLVPSKPVVSYSHQGYDDTYGQPQQPPTAQEVQSPNVYGYRQPNPYNYQQIPSRPVYQQIPDPNIYYNNYQPISDLNNNPSPTTRSPTKPDCVNVSTVTTATPSTSTPKPTTTVYTKPMTPSTTGHPWIEIRSDSENDIDGSSTVAPSLVTSYPTKTPEAPHARNLFASKKQNNAWVPII